MELKVTRMGMKIKNEELRKRGIEARKRGEPLSSNPYRDRSAELVSQSMREHRAQQWTMGWKKEDALRRFKS